MADPTGNTRRPSNLRSKREYVPPLMLAKGRGKGLAGLYPFKSNARPNVDGIGASSDLLQRSKRPITHSSSGADSLCVNKGHITSNKRPFGNVINYAPTISPNNVERNVRASFNPLPNPHIQNNNDMNVDDHNSSSESCNENINDDNELHYSSPEDEDMHYQEGYANSDGHNNESNFQDDENDNEMEAHTTVQGDASGNA